MPYVDEVLVNLTPELIGEPANGVNLYQVPNASMKVMQAILNAAWNEGKEGKYNFEAKIAALSDTGGLLNGVAVPVDITGTAVTVPTVTAPGVTIPASVTVGDIYSDFGTEYVALGTWLEGKFTAFQTAYFPSNAATFNAAESWIQGALANPNAAIPLAVQAQIIGDDQARIMADATRASDAVLTTFAARRFPLPPGAAASAVMQIQQKAQDAVAESSRKVAMASVEQMKFAVDKALTLRNSAMSAAIEYIKALTSAPDVSSRMVGVGYDAQSKLISSAAQFYGADTNAKEMMSKVAQFNSTLALDVASKNQAVDMGMVEAKIKALLAEAQSLAQMATSMFNNLHASVSMQAGGSTITTQSQDVA